MRILGPLVCASPSPVTATLASALASLVTVAPSTTRATGSDTDAPGSESSFSTLNTSPTATLYCLPPVLTIAYVAIVACTSASLFWARATGGCVRVWGAEPDLRPSRCRRHQPGDNCSRLRDQRVEGQTAASPYTRSDRATKGCSDIRSSIANDTFEQPAPMLRNLWCRPQRAAGTAGRRIPRR